MKQKITLILTTITLYLCATTSAFAYRGQEAINYYDEHSSGQDGSSFGGIIILIIIAVVIFNIATSK